MFIMFLLLNMVPEALLPQFNLAICCTSRRSYYFVPKQFRVTVDFTANFFYGEHSFKRTQIHQSLSLSLGIRIQMNI